MWKNCTLFMLCSRQQQEKEQAEEKSEEKKEQDEDPPPSTSKEEIGKYNYILYYTQSARGVFLLLVNISETRLHGVYSCGLFSMV